MKGTPIERLIYEHMIPRPKSSDPQNFYGVLAHLILEVRHAVHTFYGHIKTQEAKYPGLDYTNRIHRIRLSRYPWHRRLFRTFDALGLTAAEIGNITKWEGTKWAKDSYEKEQGIKIHDTAGDGIPDLRVPGSRYLTDTPETMIPEVSRAFPSTLRDEDMYDVDGYYMNSEDEIRGIGLEPHEWMRRLVAAHVAGDTSQPIEENLAHHIEYLRNSGQIEALRNRGELENLIDKLTSTSTSPIHQSHNAICRFVETVSSTSTENQCPTRDSRTLIPAYAAQSHSWHRSRRLPTSEATH